MQAFWAFTWCEFRLGGDVSAASFGSKPPWWTLMLIRDFVVCL